MKADRPLGLAVIGLLVVLTACGGAREKFGLDKPPPDEFRVQSRAPLSMPPDINLRPPQQGSGAPTARAGRPIARPPETGVRRASGRFWPPPGRRRPSPISGHSLTGRPDC
jgi:hypothetical protein